uniref:LOW QUALITY PROTEIN: GTPase IMAP family member 7-like n=1 Tax=Oncorhynchus gorbuscha TaxID=8017 RepID=UPI001EAEA16F|nr:LOW QUALITY PROTEIN: GTPase IMAP family member 7-like [Oncorhynchus gorbuscha]
MASGPPQTELRLVLLGGTRAGQSAAGNAILGRQAFITQTASEPAVTQECEKTAGRWVSVVVAQDWFCSERPPEEVRHHVSSCVALSAPGPHAFLLCVPVDRPADMELRALEALEKVFGPTAVSGHTLVLFTHTDQMVLGQQLDEYIATRRKDLLELVVTCGDRYHSLERRSRGEKDERKSVEELLEKVEQTVKESGVEFYSCPLYQEAEARVREKQAEIVWQRRGEEELNEEVPSSASPPEEELDDEEMARVREEAERSVHNLNIDTEGIASLSPASSPSFLLSLWQGLTGWLRRLPKMLRMESLLGAFVGLFVGGPVGRMLGATVGSVATEVGRRKTLKTEKNK